MNVYKQNLVDGIANNMSFAESILKIVCLQLRNRAVKHGPFEIHGIRVDAAKEPLRLIKNDDL